MTRRGRRRGQGRIKHDKLEGADPAPDFLAAAALAPERAEPLIWLCWHYHKRLDACAAADRVCRLQNRVAAFYYARAAAAVPYPPEVRRGPHGPHSIAVRCALLVSCACQGLAEPRAQTPRTTVLAMKPPHVLFCRISCAHGAAAARRAGAAAERAARGCARTRCSSTTRCTSTRRRRRSPSTPGTWPRSWATHTRWARAQPPPCSRRTRCRTGGATWACTPTCRRCAAPELRRAAPLAACVNAFSCAWLCPDYSDAAASDWFGRGVSPPCKVRERWRSPGDQAACEVLLLHGCVQAAEARELAEARACCAAAEAPPPAHGGNIFMAGGFEARVHGAATA